MPAPRDAAEVTFVGKTDDTREEFLRVPGYKRVDGIVTWRDRRDLDAGYQRVVQMVEQGKTVAQIQSATKLPVFVVRDVRRRWIACRRYPATQTVLDQRLAGMTMAQIARQHGIDVQSVREMLEAELHQMEGPAGQYALEVARAESLFAVLAPEIKKANFQAIQLAIRISEHKLSVIETQIQAAKAISKAGKTLSQILSELDAEVEEEQHQKRLANNLADGERDESQGDAGGGEAGDDEDEPAGSIDDC